MAQALRSIPDDSAPGSTPACDVRLSAQAMQAWLHWQCGMIHGAIRASLFTIKTDAGQVYADQNQAHWPDSATNPSQLLLNANSAVQKRAPVVSKVLAVADGSKQLECLSIPLPGKEPRFVLSLLISLEHPAKHADLVKLVQWGSYWLIAESTWNTQQPQERASSSDITKSLVATTVESKSLLAACFETVACLAAELACERVSIGLLDGQRVKLKAISGLPHFDHRMRLVRLVEQAMEEALDQAATIDSSASNQHLIKHQHSELLQGQVNYALSALLQDDLGTLGVLTLERTIPNPLEPAEIDSLERLAAAITPVLRLHRLKEQSFLTRLKADCHNWFSQTRLLVAAVLFIALVASAVLQGQYRITSDVTIEGADKQVVVAPFAGFILSAKVRAGEEVEAGQVLASLDVSSLQVEQDKWQSELNKVEKTYSRALAASDRVELSLAAARRAELSAELLLVRQRIERSEIRAPFRGVVVSGDLHQLLGAPVEPGQVLFEIASMDQFRPMLDIDEESIADIYEGQQATIRLASMPGVTHQAVLKSLRPVAVMVDGKNVFRMEAELLGEAAQFRPGMHGVAKIVAGDRAWLWLWSHRLVKRIRIWLWSVGF